MADSRDADARSRKIVRSELQTNLLLEAGAGSGKTQMLAERMAAGVATGVYEIEHMAAVTFTRKAASELRGRFHLALESELQQLRNGTPTRRLLDRRSVRLKADELQPAIHRIEGALSNLERFFAGTIHAFCARLLRERPVEAGVSPGFTELDEVQDLELRQRTWRDFVTSARSAGDRDVLALLDADIKPRDLDDAFAMICLNEDVEFPTGDAEQPDADAARKALDKFWKALQKELPPHIDRATTCSIQKAAVRFKGDYQVWRYRLDEPAVIASLLDVWDCESKIIQKWWADSTEQKRRLRDLIQPLHESFHTSTVQPYLSQWRQYVYRLAVTLLTRARDHATADRRRANTLNYGDLLIMTARVLRENADVRHSLQRKYRHLFVDEFQDTDPVQAEIVFLLAANDRSVRLEPDRTADWRTVPLRPGALFVVGDPKQSIYRFRRADIDIYNIVRERFSDKTVGQVLPLTMNFRSIPLLCQWANDVFKQRFPDKPTPMSPRFAALDPHEKNDRPGGVFTITHAGDRNDAPLDDAARIAAHIRTEVDAGRRRFSDFLILTRRKRDRLRPYVTALEALNVPLEVSGAGAFGQSVEVNALIELLRALADPQDAIALVAVLRGPFFGVSDRELFAFRQSGGWFTIFQGDRSVRLQADPALEPVRAALDTLFRYYRWTRMLPAAAALERILEDSGYLALAATTPGGVEAGDLLHAIDRVRHVVEEGGTLADAAESLEEDADDGEVESLPLEPGRTDVVRLMNLHKAKGLEAAVVFLADPTGGFGPRVDRRIVRTEGGAQGWFRISKRFQNGGSQVMGEPADWASHEAAETPYLQAEEDRLFYVAATRAREQLVVSRWLGGSQRFPAWGVLNNALAGAQELPTPATVTQPVVEPLDCSASATAQSTSAREAAHAGVRQASWSVSSVTAEAKHLERTTEEAPAAADDPTRVVTRNTPAHRADAGMAWGSLIHGLLEHAMRHGTVNRNDLRRLGLWLTVEEPQLRPVLDQAIDVVIGVAQSDFWRTAKAGEHLEETPFTVRQAEGALSNGVIDLLCSDGGAWRIRDYKTDVSLDAAEYDKQLQVYRNALQNLSCAVLDAALIHVRPEQTRTPMKSY